jgi:WD40 repeat protein
LVHVQVLIGYFQLDVDRSLPYHLDCTVKSVLALPSVLNRPRFGYRQPPITSTVNAIAFSPDSKQLASASNDYTVRLWDAVTGVALQVFEGHTSIVNAVAFSPDGKQLASRSNGRTIRLWDATTGAALQTLEGHTYVIGAVASNDQTVRL